MRLTDFWERMEQALGPTSARSWAHAHVLAELGGRTVDESIDDGIETVAIWRAVHRELALHPRER